MPKISPVLPSGAKRAHTVRNAPPAPARSGTRAPAEVRRPSAPGKFELVRADGDGFLIRILDGNGNGAVLALSRTYPDIAAAVQGVGAVRECAATSHISDQTAGSLDAGSLPTSTGPAWPAAGLASDPLPLP